MPSTEGTYIYLLCGIVALILAFKNLAAKSQTTPSQLVPILQPQQTETVSATSTLPALSVSLEKRRAELEAELEAKHREEWCRKFEQEEISRKFREKYCQHVFNRQYEDGALRLAAAQNRLMDLVAQREALQTSMFADYGYDVGCW